MAKKLVPITREYLRKHYEDLVIDPEPSVFAEIRLSCVQICNALHLCLQRHDSQYTDLRGDIQYTAPKKVDENFYRNREQCEAIVTELLVDSVLAKFLGSDNADVKSLGTAFASLKQAMSTNNETIAKYQKERMQSVEALVKKFLPNDFRMSLVQKFRERSERKNAEMIAEKRASGMSVHALYDMLWQQQMQRRETLVQLGQASGIFKAFLRLLAGVPSVLLDFVRTINDENGPMEEMRQRYGPFLYRMTEFLSLLRVLVLMSVRALSVAPPDDLGVSVSEITSVVQAAGAAYTGALAYYLAFMSKVWDASPFFLEEYQTGGALTSEPATDITIAARSVHDVFVDVPTAGWTLAWELDTHGKDVGFGVMYGSNVLVKPSRVDSSSAKVEVPAWLYL